MRRVSNTSGLRQLILADHRRSLQRWRIPGRADELEDALESGAPVVVSASRLMRALLHARLPCDRLAFGGQDHGKVFLLDERDQLTEAAQ
jgi:hypothetical protein